MLTLSIIFFSLAAILGLLLLAYILKNKHTPKFLALIHGPLAFTALILLIIYSCLAHSAPVISIVLFALAAAGGLILIFRDITGKPIPKGLAIGHGLLAITGFILLIWFASSK